MHGWWECRLHQALEDSTSEHTVTTPVGDPLCGRAPEELRSGSHLSSRGHGSSYCGSENEEATKCLPMDEQVSKTWSTHTMEYFKP